MRQLQQDFGSSELELIEVPEPHVSSNGVLVDTRYSLVSAGTERAMIELANKTLLGKAKERPELVKQVINKARNDGLRSTYRSVKSRLDEPFPLGYSCSGRVIQVGEEVANFSVGDVVACGGAGYATHANVNHVPENLCVSVPDEVSLRDAAFTTVGAIALQGIRRLDPTPGERIAVIGLGLVGRLTTKLLAAYGYPVLGIDIDPTRVDGADELTVGAAIGEDDISNISTSFGEGEGVDGVIITAATESNQPIKLAGEILRERGRVSVVGDIGMDIPRAQYYEGELDVHLSRSYGPGRYDRRYEEKGLDYPIGYVRWTENRNMAEFLRLLDVEAIHVDDVVTHTFSFDDALDAYDLILGDEEHMGVLLEYEHSETSEKKRRLDLQSVQKGSTTGQISLGIVGAGSFAQSVLLPTIVDVDGLSIRAVATATGTTATAVGEKYDAAYVTTDYEEIINDEAIDAVVVATRHNLHAEIATAALEANKDVHVEKPPVLTRAELDQLIEAEQRSSGRLMVGYNRRFASSVNRIREWTREVQIMARYRINAGSLPDDHWTVDPDVGGGRILGEVCHFVDLLQYLVGERPSTVYACGPEDRSPTQQNVQVSIEFADGSCGSITYTTFGDDGAGKEHIEVLGGGRIETIDDFKTGRFGLGQDKGFEAEFRAFRDAIREGDESPIPIDEIVTTSLVTFGIEESLRTNEPVRIEREYPVGTR